MAKAYGFSITRQVLIRELRARPIPGIGRKIQIIRVAHKSIHTVLTGFPELLYTHPHHPPPPPVAPQTPGAQPEPMLKIKGQLDTRRGGRPRPLVARAFYF